MPAEMEGAIMEVGITNDIGAAYQSIPNVLALSTRATTAVALGLLVESADIGPCTLIEAPAAPRPIVETRQNWARRRCALLLLLLLLRLRGQGASPGMSEVQTAFRVVEVQTTSSSSPC